MGSGPTVTKHSDFDQTHKRKIEMWRFEKGVQILRASHSRENRSNQRERSCHGVGRQTAPDYLAPNPVAVMVDSVGPPNRQHGARFA